MAGNDWNKLGRDVKEIVQEAIDSGNFAALNRDLGRTLENALGNMAQSVKNAAKTGMAGKNHLDEEADFGQDRYGQPYEAYERNHGSETDMNSGSNENRGSSYRYGNHYNQVYRPYGNYRRSLSNRKIREAKREFALFARTGGSRVLGSLPAVLGIGVAVALGIVSLILGISNITEPIEGMGVAAVLLSIVAAASAIIGICGNNLRKKVKRFRSYIKTLNGKSYASIRDLSKSVRKSEKFVLKDLKKMIDKRMFLEGHLDKNETCLIATDEAYEQYTEMEKNQQELREQEARRPKKELSEDVKKVIEEGEYYVEEIRRSNDAIPGIEISNKMYHLENVIRRIFQRVEQHPELIQDLHKFMDYYLPTTMKLLNAYEELDRQDMQGENIKTAKQEIENTLDTINIAFENLLDSFYKETAWDVSSDISVLKTMLAQEGLTGEKDFQGKE